MSVPKVSVLLSLFRAERFLSRYLEDVLEQSIVDRVELSVVHNDPTDAERDILNHYAQRITMVRCETPRESLYASWNRALAQSRGEYVACWNVDDLRVANSLELMACTLDTDPGIGWTYGDFSITHAFGRKEGKRISTPEWSRELGTKGAIGGPFFMWRRSLVDRVGWFDEQFSSGGDFDYTVRLSMHSKAIRTPDLHGYFLHERAGLSTAGHCQPIERTVIQLRYGIYETLDWSYVHPSLSFRTRHFLQPESTWVPVEKMVPEYERLIEVRSNSAWHIPWQTAKAVVRRRLASMLGRR